ncbi:hypothetical protein BaRGS_00029917 [Batillaria attramentaria]|uniref:RRM domain-containing protein n=1 Tax=Batillaria attramentaria TaxID=370345 RepID=A0ABD0JV81_9CAEN
MLCRVTQNSLRKYFTDSAVSGGGPVERVVTLSVRYTYVVHFRNHKDAVNVVCRDNHACQGVPLSVFLYDEQSRSVYSGRHTVSSRDSLEMSVHGVDVPLVDREASTTVLVTGVGSDVTDDNVESALGCEQRHVLNIKRLRNTWIAFVRFQHHEDALRVVGMEQAVVACDLMSVLRPLFPGRIARPAVVNLFLFLFRGPLPDHTNPQHKTEISVINQQGSPQVNQDPTVDDPQSAEHLAPFTTVLVCTGYVREDDLHKYFTKSVVSSGVERVVKLAGFTYIVHFYNYEDPLKRTEHAVDVPLVDREASTTVLITDLDPDVTDKDLKSALDKLSIGRRPVQNIKRLHDTGIAFVQFQHHEDALRVAGMKEAKISYQEMWFGRRTTRTRSVTVEVFLFRGPLPCHAHWPQKTHSSVTDHEDGMFPTHNDYTPNTDETKHVKTDILAVQTLLQSQQTLTQEDDRSVHAMPDAQAAEFRAMMEEKNLQIQRLQSVLQEQNLQIRRLTSQLSQHRADVMHELETVNKQTQASLQMQDRMHKNQMVNLTGEMRNMQAGIIRIQSQLAAQAGQTTRQVQTTNRAEPTMLFLAIANTSDCDSTSGDSSNTLPVD